MDWDWIPRVRCGPFHFGEPLPELPDVEIVLLEPSCEGAEWQIYRIGDEEASVAVEDGKITSIECWKSMKYLGNDELLGLPVQAIERLLATTMTLAERWDGGSRYDADDIGLMLWVEGQYVESATVYDDED